MQQRRTTAGVGPRRTTVSLAIRIAPEQDDDHKTTFGECFINLFKSFVGAGILALPRGFERGGIVGSSIMMPLVAVVVWYGMHLLIQSDRVIKQQMVLERGRDEQRRGSELVRYKAEPTQQIPPRGAAHTLNPNGSVMEAKYAARTDSDAGSSSRGGVPDDTSGDVTGAHAAHGAGQGYVHRYPGSTAEGGGDSGGVGGASGEEGCGAAPDCGYEFQPFKCVQELDPYSEVARRAYSRPGEIIFQIMIVASQIGTCSAYAGFIAKNMHTITGVSQASWALILFFLFGILTQVRNPKAFAPTSVFGNAVYVFAIIVVIYGGFDQGCCFKHAGDTVNYGSAKGLAPLFGTSVFALEGIGNVLPFRNKMKNPDDFDRILKWVIGSVCVMYIIFADISYATFGSAVEAPVTDSLTNGTVTDLVKICLSIALLFSYALQLFAVTNFADVYISRMRIGWIENTFTSLGSKKEAAPHAPAGRPDSSSATAILVSIFLRLVFVGFTIIIAVAVGNFGQIIDVSGAIAGSSVGLIMPALFYLKLKPDGHRALPWSLVLIGAIAGSLSLYYTFADE